MRLRTFQKKLKLSNTDFAEKVGVTPGWLSSYYHGRITEPSARVCSRIIRRIQKLELGDVTLEDLRSTQGRGEDFNRYA